MSSSVALGELLAGAEVHTDRVLAAARRHLGMDVAFVGRFRDGRREFTHVDAEEGAPIQPGGSDPLEATYCARVVDGRLPEIIHDSDAIAEARALPITRDLGIHAYMSVPIQLSDGRVYGTFCCFSGRPDPSLDERDLALMRVLADLVAHEVEEDERSTAAAREAGLRLDRALAGGEIRVVYQPIVALEDRSVRGYEALARFADGRSPAQWFTEAQSVGRTIELELRAIALALAAFGVPGDQYLSVNVSPETLLSPRFAEMSPLRGEGLVIEITEHAAVGDYAQLWLALDPLRQRGIRVAIDDMGAGFSSLSHVLRLNADILKLDRTLVEGIDRDPARQAMAAALVRFARSTRARVLAEGIETEAELQTLLALGVRLGQGYHLGRPGELAQAESKAS